MTKSADPPHVLVVDDDRAFRQAAAALLEKAGYVTAQSGDGVAALAHVRKARVDVVLLDIGLPGMSGLDVLAEASRLPAPPRIVIVTSDDTPGALMASFRGQADRFVRKPIAPRRVVDVVKEVLAVTAAAALTIEVVSATSEWVELVAPCSLDVADRIHEFVMNLDADVPEETRESVGQAFRELLTNAIEWGGRLDPRAEGAHLVSAHAPHAPLSHCRPGRGLRPGAAQSCGRVQRAGPIRWSTPGCAKDSGLRPGGLGLLMTRALVDEVHLQREAQRGRPREVPGLRGNDAGHH